MTKEKLKDIIQWDRVNWSKALPFWQKALDKKQKSLKCLELGGREGGLSLWLALQGHDVICSDLEKPKEIAEPIHQKHGVKSVTYEAIDATDIPYTNEFDIIVFKSILGGICRAQNNIKEEEVIAQIYMALKPGGQLLFAENLQSSGLHQFARKKFTNWGGEWKYLSYGKVNQLFHQFSHVEYFTVGFFGAFGRSEKQRIWLGKMDNVVANMFPKAMRYIVIGVATK